MQLDNFTTPIVHGAGLVSELVSVIEKHKAAFEHQLIPDLSHIDVMAHNENGIVVTGVEHLEENLYKLNFTYDWQLYRGCADIHGVGIEKGNALFTVSDNGQIEIDLHKDVSRDTCEEF